jgi:putative transposase
MPKGLVRYQKCGVYHFLTFSCYRRMPLLARDTAYQVFERELEAVRRRYGFVVAGYVLMPEHVHLLVGEPGVSSLATVLQVLKQNTSRKLKSPGQAQFWQRRYYDFNVHSELKRVEKLRYMHRNPVRRGLGSKPEDWLWSSSCIARWAKWVRSRSSRKVRRADEKQTQPWRAKNKGGYVVCGRRCLISGRSF